MTRFAAFSLLASPDAQWEENESKLVNGHWVRMPWFFRTDPSG